MGVLRKAQGDFFDTPGDVEGKIIDLGARVAPVSECPSHASAAKTTERLLVGGRALIPVVVTRFGEDIIE